MFRLFLPSSLRNTISNSGKWRANRLLVCIFFFLMNKGQIFYIFMQVRKTRHSYFQVPPSEYLVGNSISSEHWLRYKKFVDVQECVRVRRHYLCPLSANATNMRDSLK